MHETNFFDASFVVFIGFIIFISVVLKYGYHKIIQTIDTEIKDIKTTVEQAEIALKNAESQALQAHKDEKRLKQEIEEFKQSAEKRIEELRQLTEAEITAQLAAKQEIADTTLDLIRHNTIISLRAIITEQATAALQEIIMASKKSVQERFNDQAIEKLSQLMSQPQSNAKRSSSKQALA